MSQTVLIVDDEEDIRILLRLNLESEGYEILEAEDGVRGLELLEAHHPDLVLLDMRMPNLDGWGFLEALGLKDKPTRPRVIALSAHGNDHTRRRAMEEGCAGYIKKPFTFDELRKVIAS